MRERDRELDKRRPSADDLQKINGIGPVVAHSAESLGCWPTRRPQ
jgi:predicted flap endonuclease-1-like 5' DNA nuclease